MLKSPVAPTSSQRILPGSKIGPSAKPSAGRVNAEAAMAPAVCAVPVMNRRRVTVSPSKAPGIRRSRVYLDFFGFRRSAMERRGASAAIQARAEPYRQHGDGRHKPDSHGKSARLRHISGRPPGDRPQRPRRAGLQRPRRGLRGLMIGACAPAHGDRSRLPHRLGQVGPRGGRVRLGAQGDDVGQLGDRREVPKAGETGEAERVELVARERRTRSASSERSTRGSP